MSNIRIIALNFSRFTFWTHRINFLPRIFDKKTISSFLATNVAPIERRQIGALTLDEKYNIFSIASIYGH